jgi:hypothetical protein
MGLKGLKLKNIKFCSFFVKKQAKSVSQLHVFKKYYYIVGERQSIYIPLRPYLNMPSVLYQQLKDNHYDKDVTRPT